MTHHDQQLAAALREIEQLQNYAKGLELEITRLTAKLATQDNLPTP